jgi:hypothetical protein
MLIEDVFTNELKEFDVRTGKPIKEPIKETNTEKEIENINQLKLF